MLGNKKKDNEGEDMPSDILKAVKIISVCNTLAKDEASNMFIVL